MTSRERMRASIQGLAADYVPCSFMIFFNLLTQCRTQEEFVEKQLALGLDPTVQAGYLQSSLHPAVSERVWTEQESGQTVFCRRLDTPKGPLTQRVAQMEGWPTRDSFWRFNDWVVPRSREFLVKPEEDLEKLPYVFGPFRDEHIARLRESARAARVLARRHQLLLAGGWSSINIHSLGDDGVMGADAMAWLSGYVPIMELSLTRPDIIKEYLRIIHEWNLRQIEIYLDITAAELIVRRAWYETTEFWTPGAYRDLVAPFLRREVEVVHQAGKLFGLICTSAFMPILDDILDTGIDVLIGLDPLEGKGTDLPEVKKRFTACRRAIWGGVSGAITVERGTEQDTEDAVRTALSTLSPGGGFILSPVDNVRDDTPRAWKNTHRLIDVWKDQRSAS